MKRYFCFFVVIIIFCSSNVWATKRVSQETRDKLTHQLAIFGMSVGDEVLIRAFKKESRLELWVRLQKSRKFSLFKTYPICSYSGDLGPKLHEGDKITPEGFYGITKKKLNPYSRFYLSMNIGYPNAYDRQLSRTGSLLMIHGACDSMGCFAMSNYQIEEIYYLVESAINAGQKKVQVHIFPFHLTQEKLEVYKNNKWFAFWKQLQTGYLMFNRNKLSPKVEAINGRYVFYEGNR